MTELSQIFEGELSKHVFIVGSILFGVVAIYAAAFVRHITQRSSVRSDRSRLTPVTIGALVMVAALVGGLNFMGASGSDVLRPPSISIAELMQQIDVWSFPEQLVGEFI